MNKQSLDPIMTLDLFPELRAALLALLASLTDDMWERPTRCCPGWSVKDMAAVTVLKHHGHGMPGPGQECPLMDKIH